MRDHCWLSAVNAAHNEQHSALKNLPLPLVQLHTDTQGLVQYHILAVQLHTGTQGLVQYHILAHQVEASSCCSIA